MNLKQKMEAAKAAWDAAVQAKKADTEIANLKAAYEAAKTAYEASDEAKGEQNIITLDEIKSTIEGAVKAAISASNVDGKDTVTADQVQKAVADALKDFKAKEDIGAQVSAAAKAAANAVIGELRAQAKNIHDLEDAAKGGARGAIEVPLGLTKGNLPVHMKQLMNCLLKKPQDEGIDSTLLHKAASRGDAMFDRFKQQGIKALTTTGSGTGLELIDTVLSTELLRRLYLESEVAMLWAAREIEMPSDTYDMPMSTTRPTFKLTAESSENALSSDPGTAKPSLASKKMTALVEYSYEANESSVIPLLSTIQQLLGEAAAYSIEDAIINGDTAATHQDSDTHAVSRHVAKSWNGLRKLALAITSLKSSLSSGNINAANLLAIKKLLKKYGVNPRNCAWIVGPMGENDMLGLDGVKTLEQFGPQATNLTGKIAAYLGIPIITSEANREDLNASGVYDGTTTTKGSIILVNHTRFLLGNRRGFTVEVDRNIVSQVNQIVASFRKAFTPIETPSATVTSVAIGYNNAA